MGFRQTPDGKNVFISIDSRITHHNPLYKAWKAKSFTDGDITLHFAILDILASSDTKLTAGQITEAIDKKYLSIFRDPKLFDESTVRKKLKEYVADDNSCRFSAEVYDTNEMIPWIRTFICRITEINFSNKEIESQFLRDLEDMYRLYELNGGVAE